jgi:asparagine synthase (glutamine-hydrolysing)
VSRICGIVGRTDRIDAMLADLAVGARGPAQAWRGAAWRGEGIALGRHGEAARADALVADAIVAPQVGADGFRAAIERLDGGFAVAWWDGGSLWLARDRLGIRPLYYARAADGFAFASRPRPLLRLPGVDRTPDPRYLGVFAGSHYRYIDNRPERSPYLGVAQVPPGHLVRVRGDDVLVTPYWGLADAPELEDDLAERYRELLAQATAGPHPGRAAFTLSGGLDSSSVLASVAAATGEPQHAYSTLYPGSEFDESAEIGSMLELVAQWHRVPVQAPDVLDLVARMIEAHDEPVATATWLSHYLLCERVAGDGFRTLFGGLGGDELNAGEYEHFFFRFADLRFTGDEATLAHEVAQWARHHDHPVFRKDAAVADAMLARVADFTQPGRVRVDRERLERYAAAVRFPLADYRPVLDHPFGSYLKNRTHQDLFRETMPCCLRAQDRQAAAWGLTTRDPFLDHRLVEFMFRVPGELKIADGVTKRLLREAMRGVLPEETRTRIAKTGWNAPADQWFADGGPVLELLGGDFHAADIYDLGEVRRLLAEHPRENHMMFFWQLVNVELWLRWLATL